MLLVVWLSLNFCGGKLLHTRTTYLKSSGKINGCALFLCQYFASEINGGVFDESECSTFFDILLDVCLPL